MSTPDEQILFYEGRYYMFSNFSSFSIEWKGRRWPTSEHAYQAAKFHKKGLQEKIRWAPSAHDAKKIAREYESMKRSNWNLIKLSVMEEILRAKLSQHSYIKERLLETGTREIIEDSPRDSFWGRGPDFKGHNHLGNLWMKLRSELQKQPAA